MSRVDLDESMSGDHEFDLVDRLAERVAWMLFDEWGAMARHGVWLGHRDVDPEVRDGQVRYYDAFDSADPAALATAARVLETTALGENVDARSAAALSDTMTTSWFLSAELDSGVLDRAEHLAVRALALDPDLVEAHLALGYVHFARRRSQLIAHEFEVALGLSPPSPSVLHAQAIVYALDGSWERAEQMMTRAATLNPRLPKYWRLVPCIAALHREEFDRAYTQSLQIGDAIGWAGPALRLACAFPLGLSLHEDVKQFLAMVPDPAAQAHEETVARTFHDPLVHDMIMRALEAGTGSTS